MEVAEAVVAPPQGQGRHYRFCKHRRSESESAHPAVQAEAALLPKRFCLVEQRRKKVRRMTQAAADRPRARSHPGPATNTGLSWIQRSRSV